MGVWHTRKYNCRGLDLPAAIVTLMPAPGAAVPPAHLGGSGQLLNHIHASLVEQVGRKHNGQESASATTAFNAVPCLRQ